MTPPITLDVGKGFVQWKTYDRKPTQYHSSKAVYHRNRVGGVMTPPYGTG